MRVSAFLNDGGDLQPSPHLDFGEASELYDHTANSSAIGVTTDCRDTELPAGCAQATILRYDSIIPVHRELTPASINSS